MDNRLRGRLLACAAAFCRGIIPVLVRSGVDPALVRHPLSPLAGSFIALLGGILCYFPVLWWQGIARGFFRHLSGCDRRGLLFYGLAGLCNAVAVICWYTALVYAPAVIVAPIEGTNRLFTLAIAYFTMQHSEKINWRIAAGVAVTVIGTFLIVTA